jgi:hypothetical protein
MNTKPKKDLVVLALNTFIEVDSPIHVERIGDGIIFQTVLGNSGVIRKHINQDWGVYINEELVYSIEDQVFDILYNSENAPDIDEYTSKLKEVYSTQLQEKSKVFVGWIIEGIMKMAMSGQIKIHQDLQHGPFVFLNSNNLGDQNIILN